MHTAPSQLAVLVQGAELVLPIERVVHTAPSQLLVQRVELILPIERVVAAN